MRQSYGGVGGFNASGAQNSTVGNSVNVTENRTIEKRQPMYEVTDVDKQKSSSAKKLGDFQRSYTAEVPGAGGFLRQS